MTNSAKLRFINKRRSIVEYFSFIGAQGNEIQGCINHFNVRNINRAHAVFNQINSRAKRFGYILKGEMANVPSGSGVTCEAHRNQDKILEVDNCISVFFRNAVKQNVRKPFVGQNILHAPKFCRVNMPGRSSVDFRGYLVSSTQGYDIASQTQNSGITTGRFHGLGRRCIGEAATYDRGRRPYDSAPKSKPIAASVLLNPAGWLVFENGHYRRAEDRTEDDAGCGRNGKIVGRSAHVVTLPALAQVVEWSGAGGWGAS